MRAAREVIAGRHHELVLLLGNLHGVDLPPVLGRDRLIEISLMESVHHFVDLPSARWQSRAHRRSSQSRTSQHTDRAGVVRRRA